ncbi:nuclear transport factor 2 family protein [Sediminicola luteus]|nr:nuclear transport factor 2 family protein [Sediminicola luteus]
MKPVLRILSVFVLSGMAYAQEPSLENTIQKLDSLLFEAGFNQCHIQTMAQLIAEDLEFYHDEGGVSHGKDVFLKITEQNICGNPDKKPLRELDKASHKIYPLYDQGKLYGAVQYGIHRFYIKEPQKDKYLTSTAQFTHLWLKRGNQWVLKRVLSYDHKAPQ